MHSTSRIGSRTGETFAQIAATSDEQVFIPLSVGDPLNK